ncbi:MAG: hypothetical protein HONDAALG_03365 [Gammaproteobacteria bacterium]|nr:hypothetical protein [Gammaproteobacteria bacterium]
MKKRNWKTRVGKQESSLRAGGRRRYNAMRQARMWDRRFALLRLCTRLGEIPHGRQNELAERYSVSQPVISRDLAWVRENIQYGYIRPPKCTKRGRIITIEWRWP